MDTVENIATVYQRTTIDQNDYSPSNFKFNPFIGSSLREYLRDYVDAMIRRPIYKIIYGKKFAHLPYQINLVLPEKGMSILSRRHLLNQYLPLKNSRILVIGCGTAWDFGSYLRFQPKEIVGIDLYNFTYCWNQVQKYAIKAKLPTQVTFHQVDIADLENMVTGEFDIIASDDVFEHCKNLESVLKTLHSLLRNQGIMYAGYGPLYWTWGGDHFSGRGGIENGFNHLILDSEAYKTYYHNYLLNDNTEVQNGGRYIKLDLFSKLTSQEYFELYKKTGFNVESSIVYFSKYAEVLQGTEVVQEVINKNPAITIDDLIIKSHYMLLSKHSNK